MNDFQLTKEGLEKLQQELKELKEVQRPAVVKELKEARAQGDLSENADYDAARNKQAEIEGRIIQIEQILSKASETKIVSSNKNKVSLGSVVELYNESTKKTEVYKVVSTVEANFLKRMISNECALAKAIIGKEVTGEFITVNAPVSYRVQIKSINEKEL